MKSSTVVSIDYLVLTLLIGIILGSWLEFKVHGNKTIVEYSPNNVEHYRIITTRNNVVVSDLEVFHIKEATVQLTEDSKIFNCEISISKEDLYKFDIDSIGYSIIDRRKYQGDTLSQTLDTILINTNTDIKQIKI